MDKEYYDDTFGLLPEKGTLSFNNIVYSVQYNIGRKLKKLPPNPDLEYLKLHIHLTHSFMGGYVPKNSHDNITYKIAALQEYPEINKYMNPKYLSKKIGWYRIWDVIIYHFLYEQNVIKQFIYSSLMFIPAIQTLFSVYSKHKIRPKLWKDRWKWWYLPKKELDYYEYATFTQKTYETPFGKKEANFFQNDGKHISLFKIRMLKNKSIFYKLIVGICHRRYVSVYGRNYAHKVFKRYFRDQNHPVIGVYENLNDFLLL